MAVAVWAVSYNSDMEQPICPLHHQMPRPLTPPVPLAPIPGRQVPQLTNYMYLGIQRDRRDWDFTPVDRQTRLTDRLTNRFTGSDSKIARSWHLARGCMDTYLSNVIVIVGFALHNAKPTSLLRPGPVNNLPSILLKMYGLDYSSRR